MRWIYMREHTTTITHLLNKESNHQIKIWSYLYVYEFICKCIQYGYSGYYGKGSGPGVSIEMK